MAEVKDEERRHERKAKYPWPNKSELSKRTPVLTDTEGRKYYMVDFLKEDKSEFRVEFVKNVMQQHYKKDAQGYWIMLPANTTLGGMPEQSTDVHFKVAGLKMTVLAVTEMVERKQRGTGFIVFRGG
jgi:hypothetical protein